MTLKDKDTRPPRCINIDWLEVYAFEPIDVPHTPDYYRAAGFCVTERLYGTRMYEQMFTLEDNEGNAILEVRRQPKSEASCGGFFPINASHLRLVNRQCYRNDAVSFFRAFLEAYGYEVARISRIDICLDFVRFDSGDWPEKMLHRYMQGKYTKINQSQIASHGRDWFTGRKWNSISWGKPRSPIGTKMYNKTLELSEGRDKPYIKQQWLAAGFIDNPLDCSKNENGKLTHPQVWRIEFSIRSAVKRWVVLEKDGNAKQFISVRNTFEMYDSPEKLLAMFTTLANHYFHFKIYENGKSKYECKDKNLFHFTTNESFVKVEHPASARPRDYDNTVLLNRLRQFRNRTPDITLCRAADTLIQALERKDLQRFLSDPASRNELLALQQTLAARLAGAPVDPGSLMAAILEAIKEQVIF